MSFLSNCFKRKRNQKYIEDNENIDFNKMSYEEKIRNSIINGVVIDSSESKNINLISAYCNNNLNDALTGSHAMPMALHGKSLII